MPGCLTDGVAQGSDARRQVIGTGGGFLLLEGPTLGLAILAAMAVLVRLAGQATAGVGGLLIGVGAIWVAALGRVKLTCTVAAGFRFSHPDLEGALRDALGRPAPR